MIGASVIALVLTAAALAVALTAAASARGDSRALSRQLVPAAASSVTLISLYNAQQTALRDYVTAGRSGTLAPYRAIAAQIQARRIAGRQPDLRLPGDHAPAGGDPGRSADMAEPRGGAAADRGGPW